MEPGPPTLQADSLPSELPEALKQLYSSKMLKEYSWCVSIVFGGIIELVCPPLAPLS